jgi:hypothetical protein
MNLCFNIPFWPIIFGVFHFLNSYSIILGSVKFLLRFSVTQQLSKGFVERELLKNYVMIIFYLSNNLACRKLVTAVEIVIDLNYRWRNFRSDDDDDNIH